MPKLRKQLGQHHLIDGRLCRPLVEYLRPAGAVVVEIGPGGGVLTAELLAAGARVTAWELDPAWAVELRRRYPSRQLRPVLGDALDVPWEHLPEGAQVAGNLPYQVSTALIEAMLTRAPSVSRAAFLVQKEVAERLVARPGDGAYGSLSVLVAAWCEIRWLGRVRRGSFRPPPKVEGAFVGLTPRQPPLPRSEMPAFTGTVRLAFGQRRKTLRNSLAAGWGRAAAETVLATAGIDPGRRAETLSLDELLAVHGARERAVPSLHCEP